MKFLFLCTGNSARSIMAEALLRHHGSGKHDVFSAGTEPHGINPLTLNAIEYFGLSTAGLESKGVDKLTNSHFDYVITLCDKAAKECERLVSGKNFIAWDFPEPSSRKDSNPFVKTLQELNERIKTFSFELEKHKTSILTPTAFYKALADGIRLKTLLIICVEKEACVCEIMTALNQESQPKVSRHLALLRKAGILSDRKYQQWVFYSINPTLPAWMKQTITSTLVNEPNFIEKELTLLNQMGDRPTRIASCCN